MAVNREIPPTGEWSTALRRYGVNPEIEEYAQGYERGYRTRCIEVQGVRARTIFISEKPFIARLVKLGWKDETEAVRAEAERRARAASPEVEVPASPSPDTSQAKVAPIEAKAPATKAKTVPVAAPTEVVIGEGTRKPRGSRA